MCLQNTITLSQLNIFHLAHLDILNKYSYGFIYACPLRDSKPSIPAKEGPQTHALDRAATGTDQSNIWSCKFSIPFRFSEQNLDA
jgi:hypothetical protein